MATTLAPPRPKTPSSSGGSGLNGNGFHGGFGGGDSGAHGWEVPSRAYRTGLWMGLVAIVMLFAAFTSALVVRKGMSTDWVSTTLPPVIYLNTFILLSSSLTLEISRRSLKAGFGRGSSAGCMQQSFWEWRLWCVNCSPGANWPREECISPLIPAARFSICLPPLTACTCWAALSRSSTLLSVPAVSSQRRAGRFRST